MKVTWNARALRKHRQHERVSRVKARLSGTPVGDIAIGVPLLTERQIADLGELNRELRSLQERLEDALESLDASLSVLRGENHPEGWAEIVVAERATNVLVATIKHHKPTKKKALQVEREKLRKFGAGCRTRSTR